MNLDDLKIALNLATQIDLSIQSILLSLLVSFICALVIRESYINFGKSLNNREYFANNFILLAVTTTIVITVVKFSFALSLGLVGALSIVRFRAAIKEPEVLVYLFLVITLGICSGADQYAAAIILAIFSYIFMLFHNKRTKSLNKFLSNIIEVSIEKNTLTKNINKLQLFLENHCNEYRFKHFSFLGEKVNLSLAVYINNEYDLEEFVKNLNAISSKGLELEIIHQVPINE